MDRTFQKFLQSKIDLSSVGVEFREDNAPYFCTPKGASIFGWAGVDGIHFCFIRGFGSMVFAISPMNCPGEYVHPVAKNFDDFLRLLLVCDGDAAIEQCWQWSQEHFDKFMGEQEVLPETKEAAMHLMELTGLEPMELPYKYIRDLQKSFNYKSIPFSEEYYETVAPEDLEEPEEILCEQPATPWAVYYEDNFWAEDHEGIPCEEISFEKHFRWADREWYIPSIYTCAKGMVVDILMRVDAVEFQSFVDRWGVTVENEHTFSREQRKKMEQGKIFKFHNDLDTDQIIASQYLLLPNLDEMKGHAFESLDPDFSKKVKPGDFVVGGENFGCGSSREQAPGVLKALGVQAVVAKSFARIFYRNSINIGLPVIVCKDLPDEVNTGDKMVLHMSEGTVEANGKTYSCTKLPEYMQNILNQGGLIASLNKEEK